MDILTFLTFYLNHLSPLQGYFYKLSRCPGELYRRKFLVWLAGSGQKTEVGIMLGLLYCKG